MGVKGLWKLVLPIGRRISIETLSGQTLAIDASIWLTQFLQAMRDPETGKVVQAAHLIGFFRRICRLYYHEIRPVFVFDGATPEIKRKEVLRRKRQRDVFASNFNDMTVQRIAKKLLSNNIHKAKLKLEKGKLAKKKNTTQDDDDNVEGGAFASGFNPGSQRQASAAAANQTVRTTAEDQKELEAILAETPATKEDATVEVNDWDLPLAVAAAEEAKDIESEEDERQMSRAGDDGFITEVVASLPSHKRKDAIEKAHRAQRMRSRREFMPAAAKPQDFSNVQVKNFLRYCKLNQEIVSMAKKAASQEGTDGKAMASDLTTRIELIRESEEEYETDSTAGSNGDGPKSLLKERLELKKRRRDALRRTASTSSDESWDEKKQPPTRKSSRRTTVLYDSDESAADRQQIGESKKLIHIQDSSEEEAISRSNDDCKSARHGTAAAAGADILAKDADSLVAQELEDHQLALALQEEEDQHQPKLGFERSKPQVSNQSIVLDIGEAERRTPDHALAGQQPETPKPQNETSSDESVDWEDGEDNTEGWEASIDVDGVLPTKKDAAEKPISETSSKIHTIGAGATADDEPISPAAIRTHETSAALQQAQETASHLANWAGRAFKRAMKEAGEAASAVDVSPETDTIESPSMTSNHPCDNNANPSTLPTQERGTKVKRGVTRDRPSIPTAAEPGDAADLIDWSSARNRGERDRDGLTDEMLIEAKQMLQLFGIPYVDAPAEAEATCVALEQLGLVNGIVSDDSDVFVFGGKTVYKNIFEEQRFAEVYKAADAEREMGLSHNSMVALAMLLGSDYTEGVKGVGIVNAMEILKAFDVANDLKDGLKRFGKWMDGFDPTTGLGQSASDEKGPSAIEQIFHAQHRSARTRWETPNNFPSDAVMRAYLDPVVDRSEDRFSWGAPDVENLIGFCEAHMGWSAENTRRQLEPVVKAQQNRSRQTRIDSFMTYEDSIKFGEVKSKRLRKVLGLQGTSEQTPHTNARKERDT